MRKIHVSPMNPTMTIIVCVLFLTGITVLASADDLPPSIREKILQRFPGAVITQTRPDTWKGQPVTEVEITARILRMLFVGCLPTELEQRFGELDLGRLDRAALNSHLGRTLIRHAPACAIRTFVEQKGGDADQYLGARGART